MFYIADAFGSIPPIAETEVAQAVSGEQRSVLMPSIALRSVYSKNLC